MRIIRPIPTARFRFEMVNPREKEAFEAEAGRYRIQPMQAQVLEDDQLTVKMVYMGLVFLAGDKTETIPVLGDVNGLEYTLTSTIKRLTQDEMPIVGVIQGHGRTIAGCADAEPTPDANRRARHWHRETASRGDLPCAGC